MSKQNDISDLSLQSINNGGALSLPIRTEKTILSSANPTASQDVDFHISAARRASQNYVYVSIPGRGGNTPGVFNTSPATYRFLINPAEVQVQRQTIDQQSLTRNGWQIGVWGEDFLSIQVSGKTPGKYFNNGLTDFYTPLTESYRNLLALELVFENNGYWFEGEQAASKLTTYRNIKMHQDITLAVGEFVWDGMFESMETTEDAESPYLADFSFTFISWRERFRANTPYPNSIGQQIERGHVLNSSLTAAMPPAAQTNVQNANLTSFISNPSTGNWTQS